MENEEPMLHLEVECAWGRWISDMVRGVDNFLGYLCYTLMIVDNLEEHI